MTLKNLFVLLLSFLTFYACDDQKTEEDCPTITYTDSTIEILTLGDSRVEGARPEFESYRYELWKLFVENNWNIDLIGSQEDDGAYAKFQDLCFDNDHEGTGGATTSDILATLDQVTFEKTPEIVLLGIGGNDATTTTSTPAEITDRIEMIIEKLRQLNSEVIIFVEQIAPGRSDFMTAELMEDFLEFNSLVATMATNQNTMTSPVIAIDMSEDWSDSYMADLVHYNEAGAKVVAERYYQAIKAYLMP